MLTSRSASALLLVVRRGQGGGDQDGLEALPPACALKSGGDAGEVTRWISSPKA